MIKRANGVGVGAASLTMIFSVLCLTFFAMLTLSTANMEAIMSEKNSAFVKSYYDADAGAVKIRTAILSSARLGFIPDSVDNVPINCNLSGGEITVDYRCPIDDMQELAVCFKIDGADFDILTWEMAPVRKREADNPLAARNARFDRQ